MEYPSSKYSLASSIIIVTINTVTLMTFTTTVTPFVPIPAPIRVFIPVISIIVITPPLSCGHAGTTTTAPITTSIIPPSTTPTFRPTPYFFAASTTLFGPATPTTPRMMMVVTCATVRGNPTVASTATPVVISTPTLQRGIQFTVQFRVVTIQPATIATTASCAITSATTLERIRLIGTMQTATRPIFSAPVGASTSTAAAPRTTRCRYAYAHPVLR